MKTNIIRRVLIVLCSLLALIYLLFKFVPLNSNNNLQKVLFESYLNSLEKNNEQNLQQQRQNEELSKKLEDIASNLLQKQEERIIDLEKNRMRLEKELVGLKTPPSDATLREKLAFIYPYDASKKFPAYIWQSWKFGLNDAKFDDRFKAGERAWNDKNPGFVHEVFNDDTARTMIHHLYKSIPEIIEIYEFLPTPVLKMDFFRYLMLLAKGGTYADIDTYPLQAIPNWIPENVSPNEVGIIVGIEADADSPDWKQYYSRRVQLGQWVIQSKPGHPILREIIAQTVEKAKKAKSSSSSELSATMTHLEVMKFSGSGAWTDVIFSYFNDYVLSGIYTKVTWKDFTGLSIPKLVSDVLVLPITSFSPGIDSMGSQNEDHPLAFVRHYFEMTWKPTVIDPKAKAGSGAGAAGGAVAADDLSKQKDKQKGEVQKKGLW